MFSGKDGAVLASVDEMVVQGLGYEGVVVAGKGRVTGEQLIEVLGTREGDVSS